MKTNTLDPQLTTTDEPTCATCKQYLGSQALTYTCAALRLYVEPEDETCAMYRQKDAIDQRLVDHA